MKRPGLPAKRPPANATPGAAVDCAPQVRAMAQDLPAAPGVYLFVGQSEEVPLYIGKSVNLRQRVLSHLRNADEVRMVRQTTRIDHIRTCGDIGALLLEAQLIKQRQPLYNQKLRRTRQLCAWQLIEQGDAVVPQLVSSREVDFSNTPRLYGLYASRRAAQESLQSIADMHRLCSGVLQLEKVAPGKPCFRSKLRQCAGACCAQESLEAHNARLCRALEDLQVHCWPYPGPVGLVERWHEEQQIHVLHQWCYLGSVPTVDAARALRQAAPGFDADGYKILCKPIYSGAHPVLPLWM